MRILYNFGLIFIITIALTIFIENKCFKIYRMKIDRWLKKRNWKFKMKKFKINRQTKINLLNTKKETIISFEIFIFCLNFNFMNIFHLRNYQ